MTAGTTTKSRTNAILSFAVVSFVSVVSVVSKKTLPSALPNFLSEAVRCGASQKKPLRDSSLTYSPEWFTFRDVPQIAPYHKKLKEVASINVERSITILTLNNWITAELADR